MFEWTEPVWIKKNHVIDSHYLDASQKRKKYQNIQTINRYDTNLVYVKDPGTLNKVS